MEQCGFSTESTESGVTESTESVSPSPVSGVSGWSSLDTHSSPTSVEPVSLQSMNILRKDLGDKLNRLLLLKSEMATADGLDIVYANSNQSGQDSSEVKSKFENRFEFRRGSDLPPPLPLKAPTLTLPKKPNIIVATGSPGSPRVTGSPRATGSPRSPGSQSPRIGIKYGWDSQDTSFETATSKGSQYNAGHYQEHMLLHDTLKTIQVQETTKRQSIMVINKYITILFI